MKSVKIILVSLVLFGGVLSLTSCGEDTTIDSLSNAPAGFAFTNTTGNVISGVTRGTAVQLRADSDDIILQFTTNSNVDFTNVVAGRDAANTLAHFPAATDKAGLEGSIVMFVPCSAAVTDVHVCPLAASMGQISVGCAAELVLTAEAPTSGNYTWNNAATHAGTDDCQISASVDNFGTGGFGLTSPSGDVIE